MVAHDIEGFKNARGLALERPDIPQPLGNVWHFCVAEYSSVRGESHPFSAHEAENGSKTARGFGPILASYSGRLEQSGV